MYMPRSQPRPLSAAAHRRWAERREAEARRDALYAEATAMLMPYVFSGEEVPDTVSAAVEAKQAEARAVDIPEYL
jgi:hypothetical protein